MPRLLIALSVTWTVIAVFFSSSSALAVSPILPRPASPSFESEFRDSFQSGNQIYKKLATDHPDQLRPFLDQLLAGYITASLENNSKKKKSLSVLCRAVAGEAKRLGDRFPMHQVKRYLSWAPRQLRLKSRADAELKRVETLFAEGKYGDVERPGLFALKLYARLQDEAGEGDALHLLGQAARRLTLYPAALGYHQRALAIACRTGDSLREGRSLTDLADVHERRKDWQSSLALYGQALQVLKIPAQWQEASRTLMQLGDVYTGGRDFVHAYGAYSQALAYAEGAGHSPLMAQAHDYLGYCHRQLGDFEKAMQHHRKGLEISKNILTASERSKAGARALNHLGLCCLEIAEHAVSERDEIKGRDFYTRARRYSEEALAFAVDAQDRWRQGYILRALSSIHRQLGQISDPGEAGQLYQQALDWADQSLFLAKEMKEVEWEGLALHQRGLAQVHLGRDVEGLATFRRALDIWERIGDLLSAGYARRFIGRQFHETNNRYMEAAEEYDRARNVFRKIGDSEMEACVMTDLARVYGILGRKGDAVKLYDRATAKLEGVRAKAGLPEFRKAFMGKVYDRYEEAALFMLENDLHDNAFKLAESMKARLFLDQLAEARVDVTKGIDPEMKKKRDRVEKELYLAAKEIQETYRKPVRDEGELARLQSRLEQLESELDRLRKQVRINNPLYSSIQYPEPITVSEFQTGVLKDDEALIEYLVSRKGIFCFVITRQKFAVHKLSLDETDLSNRLEAFLENLVNGPKKGEGFDRAGSAELYDILLRPLEWAFEGRTLFIVPDGILAKVPFETLVATGPEGWMYFHGKQEVKYLQSASVLALLRSQALENKERISFVGFGDPVFDYESFRSGRPEKGAGVGGAEKERATVAGYMPESGKLSRLEGSGKEVRAIEGIFTEKNLEHRALLRSDATEDKAKAGEMERFQYIHFSTHGLLAPGFQAIALSQIPDAGDDGLLTIGEIMNLKYNARLIVLSACNTGLGRVERGEGVTGLTRAVMYAGTPAAVVSLWSVDDEGTRELMVRFYDNMVRAGLPKAEALRSAKQDMLQTKYRHPFFWSAFVMYGE